MIAGDPLHVNALPSGLTLINSLQQVMATLAGMW